MAFSALSGVHWSSSVIVLLSISVCIACLSYPVNIIFICFLQGFHHLWCGQGTGQYQQISSWPVPPTYQKYSTVCGMHQKGKAGTKGGDDIIWCQGTLHLSVIGPFHCHCSVQITTGPLTVTKDQHVLPQNNHPFGVLPQKHILPLPASIMNRSMVQPWVPP